MYSKRYLLYGFGKTNRSVATYFDRTNVKYDVYIDGDQGYKRLDEYDYIIKSPGIKPTTQLLIEAADLKIPVISDLELFYKMFKHQKLILITGTNGKTTTSNYIYSLLKNHLKVYLLGNIGFPLFDVTKKDDFEEAYLIIETSSFTLTNTYTVKPLQIIITSIAKHHLEYHGTFENYLHEKIKLINNLKSNCYLIIDEFHKKYLGLNEVKCSILTPSLAGITAEENCLYYKNKIIFDNLNSLFYYDINNLKLALCSLSLICNLNDLNSDCSKLTKYPYRLEKISSNYLIYNDAKSTNIASTISAINSIELPIILILGGQIQEDDYSLLLNYSNKIKLLYLYGENKDMLYGIYCCQIECLMFGTLEEVIDNLSLSNNNCILYSPAAPSYDQFNNFLERGKLFNALIDKKITTL